MNPSTLALLIPVLALSIPIVAILANAFTKRSKVLSPDQERRINELQARVAELESTVDTLTGSVLRIEEKQDFTNRLLEDR